MFDKIWPFLAHLDNYRVNLRHALACQFYLGLTIVRKIIKNPCFYAQNEHN
jgi:hypothetical protein